MKPTEAHLQIGDGAPIAITADQIKLTEKQNPLRPISLLRLEIEFDLTPEFAEWWEAIESAAPEEPGEPLAAEFAAQPCGGWCLGECPGCCACGTKRCSGCALGNAMEEPRSGGS